jgi:hypothetical protein
MQSHQSAWKVAPQSARVDVSRGAQPGAETAPRQSAVAGPDGPGSKDCRAAVDINFGLGDGIQLTYETAWLRVQNLGESTKFGLGQSNPGLKWRFYDAGEDGLSISLFPQFFLNNPNDAVGRGITAPTDSFLMPAEFSKKFGPVDIDYEIGYLAVHKGPDGWITGLAVGHDFAPRLELDGEFYYQGTFHPSFSQPSFDFGGRYKLHSPVILPSDIIISAVLTISSSCRCSTPLIQARAGTRWLAAAV